MRMRAAVKRLDGALVWVRAQLRRPGHPGVKQSSSTSRAPGCTSAPHEPCRGSLCARGDAELAALATEDLVARASTHIVAVTSAEAREERVAHSHGCSLRARRTHSQRRAPLGVTMKVRFIYPRFARHAEAHPELRAYVPCNEYLGPPVTRDRVARRRDAARVGSSTSATTGSRTSGSISNNVNLVGDLVLHPLGRTRARNRRRFPRAGAPGRDGGGLPERWSRTRPPVTPMRSSSAKGRGCGPMTCAMPRPAN